MGKINIGDNLMRHFTIEELIVIFDSELTDGEKSRINTLLSNKFLEMGKANLCKK